MLTALALEASGVGARALELALDHARVRTQFGTPIGAFQGVAHPLADVFKQLELGRSLALWASWCVAVEDPDAGLAAAAAKAVAGDAAVFACEQAIQTQGGAGFVWENPLRRLYARALGIRSWEAGSAQLHGEIAKPAPGRRR